MGGSDRIIRFIIAGIVLTLYLTDVIGGTLAYILLGLAVIFVFTSFISFCPIYSILGINSCKIGGKK